MISFKKPDLQPDKVDASHKRPTLGRIFFTLWFLTLITQVISLQIRWSIFGGTGWLAFIKYDSLTEKLAFIALLACLCAALCGAWIALFYLGAKLFKRKQGMSARICASTWALILAADLIFRHKITAVLGDAFSFFDFASGVGGVWRMIVQTFGWYGDIIILAILGLMAFSVTVYFFFHWFLKQERILAGLDKMPRAVFTTITAVCITLAFLFMSVLAPVFPATHQLVANETMLGASFHTMLNLATDFDGDGYGYFDLPADSAPFQSDAHPHAIDIPDDGIDQDLLLGDLKKADVPAQNIAQIEGMGLPASQSFPDRKHVILVLMESVRHDMLSANIDGKPVMPKLREFVQEGAIDFEQFYATRGFTQNSVTQSFWGGFFDPGHGLADDFKEQGYQSAAFSGENLLDEGFDLSLGLNRAVDTIVDPRNMAENIDKRDTVPASMLMNEVEAYLSNYDADQPLFMYVFFQDPHFPYQQRNPNVLIDRPIKRREIIAQERPRIWRSYANQVYHLDKAAGRLIEALRKKQMLENSLIVFVSDHGESLFDDGQLLGHGIAFQNVMTHCATILWGAKKAPTKIMSHVDLRAWIHQQLETPPSLSCQPKTKAAEVDPQSGILQFLGATTVPSGISWLKANGERLVFNYANATAYTEGKDFCHKHGAPLQRLAHPNDDKINTRLNPKTDRVNSTIYSAQITDPLSQPEVQNLVRTWAYLQWFHRKD